MASLVDEELARRDGAVRNSPGARSYVPPAIRLRQQSLDYKRQHDDELAAAREAALEQRAANEKANLDRKAAASDWHRGIAEENLKRLQDANASAEKIRQAKEDLATEAQKTKDDRTLSILNDAKGFLQDARGMDPSSPKFDQQLQNLYAGYPLAGAHPAVENWQKYHLPLREKFVAAEIAAQNQHQRPNGTVRTKVGDVVTTRPLGSPDVENKIEHDRLEALVNANAGKKQDVKTIARLNELKSSLGYDLIDPKTGAAIPGSAAKPSASTAAPVAPVIGGTDPNVITLPGAPAAVPDGAAPVSPVAIADTSPVTGEDTIQPLSDAAPDPVAVAPVDATQAAAPVVAPVVAAADAAPAAPVGPDLMALAQKAIDDPNATAEHKAAAARYLKKNTATP